MMFFHGDYPEKPTLHMGSEFCQDSLTIRAAQFVQAHLFCHGGSEFHLHLRGRRRRPAVRAFYQKQPFNVKMLWNDPYLK